MRVVCRLAALFLPFARRSQAGYGAASSSAGSAAERPCPPPRRDDAAAELALELKAQANRLLQSGQVEAAEIVYSEALKVRRRARGAARRARNCPLRCRQENLRCCRHCAAPAARPRSVARTPCVRAAARVRARSFAPR
jgi:hypothetical protein